MTDRSRSRNLLFALASLASLSLACASSPQPMDSGVPADAPREGATAVEYLPCLQPAVPGGHGAPCRCTIDCAENAECYDELRDGNPGGRCLVSARCATDGDCGGTGRCESGRCVTPCTVNTDCRTGYLCFGTHCLPQCESDSQCEYGRCNPYIGFCIRPEDTLTGRPNGEACTNNDQCISRVCLPIGPTAFCTSYCSIPAQACPQNGACFSGSGDRNTGICYERCTPGEPCRVPGFTCRNAGSLPGVTLCRP